MAEDIMNDRTSQATHRQVSLLLTRLWNLYAAQQDAKRIPVDTKTEDAPRKLSPAMPKEVFAHCHVTKAEKRCFKTMRWSAAHDPISVDH